MSDMVQAVAAAELAVVSMALRAMLQREHAADPRVVEVEAVAMHDGAAGGLLVEVRYLDVSSVALGGFSL